MSSSNPKPHSPRRSESSSSESDKPPTAPSKRSLKQKLGDATEEKWSKNKAEMKRASELEKKEKRAEEKKGKRLKLAEGKKRYRSSSGSSDGAADSHTDLSDAGDSDSQGSDTVLEDYLLGQPPQDNMEDVDDVDSDDA